MLRAGLMTEWKRKDYREDHGSQCEFKCWPEIFKNKGEHCNLSLILIIGITQ